jgi:hypothetical protein
MMKQEQALLRAAALETLIPENTTSELATLLSEEPALDAGVLGLAKRELLFIGKLSLS